jgi:hypothetical protein
MYSPVLYVPARERFLGTLGGASLVYNNMMIRLSVSRQQNRVVAIRETNQLVVSHLSSQAILHSRLEARDRFDLGRRNSFLSHPCSGDGQVIGRKSDDGGEKSVFEGERC